MTGLVSVDVNVKARPWAKPAGSAAARPDHIARFVAHPQALRVRRRPTRARQSQTRQRNAAGAKAVALRRQHAGQAQFILFLMQKYAAILHARKGEAPAVALACDAPFGPARQRAAERRGQRETPLSGAVGDDAHRVAAEDRKSTRLNSSHQFASR